MALLKAAAVFAALVDISIASPFAPLHRRAVYGQDRIKNLNTETQADYWHRQSDSGECYGSGGTFAGLHGEGVEFDTDAEVKGAITSVCQKMENVEFPWYSNSLFDSYYYGRCSEWPTEGGDTNHIYWEARFIGEGEESYDQTKTMQFADCYAAFERVLLQCEHGGASTRSGSPEWWYRMDPQAGACQWSEEGRGGAGG